MNLAHLTRDQESTRLRTLRDSVPHGGDPSWLLTIGGFLLLSVPFWTWTTLIGNSAPASIALSLTGALLALGGWRTWTRQQARWNEEHNRYDCRYKERQRLLAEELCADAKERYQITRLKAEDLTYLPQTPQEIIVEQNGQLLEVTAVFVNEESPLTLLRGTRELETVHTHIPEQARSLEELPA